MNDGYRPRFKDFATALDSILNGDFPACTIILEQDVFLSYFALSVLRDKAKLASRQVDTVTWESETERTFSQWAGQQDLFAPERLLVVTGIDHAAKLSKAMQAAAKCRSRDPILLVRKGMPTGSGFFKDAKQLGATLLPAVPPYENEMGEAVRLFSEAMRCPMKPELVRELVNHLGADVQLAYNEVKKLALIFPEQRVPIGLSEAGEHLVYLKKDSPFQLDNLLVAGEMERASAFVQGLLLRGDHPIPLLGILARHVRNTLQFCLLKKNGMNPKQIAQQLRLPFHMAPRYNEYCASLNISYLKRALAACHAADKSFKTSRSDAFLVLEDILHYLRQAHTGKFQPACD